jgi:hypothetical protein
MYHFYSGMYAGMRSFHESDYDVDMLREERGPKYDEAVDKGLEFARRSSDV